MTPSPRVMIVSAYGRGHWLSVELQRLGFNVQLVDTSKTLGNSHASDQDGPFPYFPAPQWIGVEQLVLESLGAVKEQEFGYSLLLRNGPWELRGPTSAHRAEKLHQITESLNLVRNPHEGESSRRSSLDKLKFKNFEKRWIASLAADLMSNRDLKPNSAYREGMISSLFEKCVSRDPARRSTQKSLDWCREQGVVVVDEGDIPDVAIDGKRVTGLEIKSLKSGYVKFQQIIWCLTSAETQILSEKVFQKIFGGRAEEPVWFWARYQLEIDRTPEAELLPNEFLMMDQIDLPWSHENFVSFRKSGRSDKKNRLIYEVWLRLPFSQRFQTEYLSQKIEPVIDILSRHSVRLKATLLSLPLEADENPDSLGAPLFPVYNLDLDRTLKSSHLKNLWFSQPESWPSFDAAQIISSQRQIISGLRQWWGDLSDVEKQKELEI